MNDMTNRGLTPYEFEGNNVRIVEKDGEFWFVAGDVARQLAYRDAADLTRLLDDDEKDTHPVRAPGGEQDMSAVSEAGLYRAIVMRRATTKVDHTIRERIARFQRWVFHDVLPSIRKTGSYGAAADPMVVLSDPAALRGLLLTYTEKVQKLESTVKEQAVMCSATSTR